MTDHDDLVTRAKERAESKAIPDEWGYRVALEEEEAFLGRWRGDAVDEANDDRPIHLLWDEEGQLCFSRHYAALERELERCRPLELGSTIVIARGANYMTRYDDPGEASGHTFGEIVEPSTEPLPAAANERMPF